jgi:hypothetical protein
MQEISLLKNDPSNAVQPYEVFLAKDISFDVREGFWLQE